MNEDDRLLRFALKRDTLWVLNYTEFKRNKAIHAESISVPFSVECNGKEVVIHVLSNTIWHMVGFCDTNKANTSLN